MEILTLEDERILDRVIRALRGGDVVVVPTDTVYGLIADATNDDAVRKIFEIKGREEDKPLPVFVSGIEQARKYAEISAKQERFLRRVWPGKVTVVLCTTARTHAEIDADSRGKLSRFVVQNGTIGMRAPKDEFLQSILRETGLPLAQSSANVSGEEPIRSAEEAFSRFHAIRHEPVIIVDGGICDGQPSSVVDLSGKDPVVLREGAVSKERVLELFRESGFLA